MDYGGRKRGYDDLRGGYGGGGGGMDMRGEGSPATSRDRLRNSEVSCELYEVEHGQIMFMNYHFHSGPEEDVYANDR